MMKAYSFIHGVKKTEDWNLSNSIQRILHCRHVLPISMAVIHKSYNSIPLAVLLENDQIIDELYGKGNM